MSMIALSISANLPSVPSEFQSDSCRFGRSCGRFEVPALPALIKAPTTFLSLRSPVDTFWTAADA
jgi:hypothetical protein